MDKAVVLEPVTEAVDLLIAVDCRLGGRAKVIILAVVEDPAALQLAGESIIQLAVKAVYHT